MDERQARVSTPRSDLDLARLDRSAAERSEDLAILDESQSAFEDVPAEEVERGTAAAISELRATTG